MFGEYFTMFNSFVVIFHNITWLLHMVWIERDNQIPFNLKLAWLEIVCQFNQETGNVLKQHNKSAVAEQSLFTDHKIGFSGTPILDEGKCYWDSVVLRAVNIRPGEKMFNRDGGVSAWRSVEPGAAQGGVPEPRL